MFDMEGQQPSEKQEITVIALEIALKREGEIGKDEATHLQKIKEKLQKGKSLSRSDRDTAAKILGQLQMTPDATKSLISKQRKSAVLAIGGLLLGAAVVVGMKTKPSEASLSRPTPVSSIQNPASSPERMAEKMPEDPRGRVVLDDSWRIYALEKRVSLQRIGEEIFRVVEQSEKEISQIYGFSFASKKIRIAYALNNEGMADFSGPIGIDWTGDEKGNVSYRFKRSTGSEMREGITMRGIEPMFLATLPHELIHVANYFLGLSQVRFLDEGLATYFGNILSEKLFGKSSVDLDLFSETDLFFVLFPDLKDFPLNPEFTTPESASAWIQNHIYYRRIHDFVKRLDQKRPGAVQDWLRKLKQKTDAREQMDGTLLNWDEMVDAGEGVFPGFREHVLSDPTTGRLNRIDGVFSDRRMAAQNGMVCVVNMTFTTVQSDFGGSAVTARWTDLVNPAPLTLVFETPQGRTVANVTHQSERVEIPAGATTATLFDPARNIIQTLSLRK